MYDGPIFDCDTHIVEENFDFFKDYMPQKYRDVMPVRGLGPDGKHGFYIGGKRVENYDFDPTGLVPPPGKLKEWLKAMKNGGEVTSGWIMRTPDMYNRDARVAKLDEFGVESSVLFLGEINATFPYLPPDLAGHAVIHAYNQYLNDSWGFNYKGRLLTTGVLPLWDTDAAVKETEWLIAQGVRVVVMPMGPAQGKSPAHPDFDPVWSRLNEAGIVVSYHLQDAPFLHEQVRAWGEKPLQPRLHGQTAWQWMFCYGDLPVQMTLANVIFHNFFARFPRIKMLSVECGSEWLPRFLIQMDKSRGAAKNGYWPCGQLKQRPSEIFKENCVVVSYPEDDVRKIAEQIGTAKCLAMGSDYPHAEGVELPRLFADEALEGLSASQVHAIMYDNGRRLFPA